MKWLPLRASPRDTSVPRQQRRSLPGGRAANGEDKAAREQRRSLPGGRAANGEDKAAGIREAELRELRSRGESTPEQGKPRRRLAPPVPVAVVRAPFVVLVIMSVIAGVVGILVLNTKITENAFALSNLRKEKVALDLQEEHLKYLISQHESPGNLAAAAAKLGLVESGPPAFILLPDGKIIGVPKPATAKPSVTSQ